MAKRRPRIGSVIFCESAKRGSDGRASANGIFTTALVWGYPTAVRTWFVVSTLYDLPPTSHSVAVTVLAPGGRRTTLGTVDVEGSDLGNVVSVRVSHQFEKEGAYAVEVALVGTTITARVPLLIATQPWPEFSRKELRQLAASSEIPNAIRVEATCSECTGPRVLEATPLKDHVFPPGVEPFPENGEVVCDCGHLMHLRDVEGQALASLKTALTSSRRRN